VHDAALVRGCQPVGDLVCNAQRFLDGNPALSDPLGQRRPVDELHRERRRALAALQPIDVGDVGVAQGRESLGFLLEARHAGRVARERSGQHLERDIAPELHIARTIHLAHTARANQGGDFVGAKTRTGSNRHRPLS
jgi:hypothetical protein